MRVYEIGHDAPSRKSSAVTAPPDAAFSFAANSHDGRFIPRRMRLIVTRSTDTVSASFSSVSPLRDIQSLIFMVHGAWDARACQAPRGSDAVDNLQACTQHARMPPVPKPRPQQDTFIRAWREFRGLSQEAAAGQMGIDRSTLSRIENGESPYDQPFLESAAPVYNCRVEDLLGTDPNRPEAKILDQIRSLSPDLQDTVLKMIRGLSAA